MNTVDTVYLCIGVLGFRRVLREECCGHAWSLALGAHLFSCGLNNERATLSEAILAARRRQIRGIEVAYRPAVFLSLM
ncbi:hypothetical protein BCEP4_410055 [Burkholderia cepacia]|nr:hypothetical protein BCEP4_410055 [Burkholderia cepacia]